MKRIVVLLLISSFYISCKQGLSKQDKYIIKSAIAAHQATYSASFKTDSLSKYNSFVMLYSNMGETVARHKADSIMKDLYKDRNHPYNPSFDADLTYDKFMNYCKEKGYDPVANAKLLK